MNALIKLESTLTDRYQTTVPETVRRALKLGKRDKIAYTIRPNGEVVLSRAADEAPGDPALRPFLSFLAKDMAENPQRLQLLDAGFVQRVRNLVAGVDVDLDEPLSAENE